MVLVNRLAILVPLAFALVSFVLTSLALFSGYNHGFLEDYAVVRINTTDLGRNLFDHKKDGDKKGDGKKGDGKKGGGLLGDIQEWWDETKDGAKDKLNDIAGDVVGVLADKLGVSEWYSLHIMDSCQGQFSPVFNVTNCTTSSPGDRFNLTAILDHELRIGPVKINLADINWPESLQDKIDLLNSALLGLFVVYAVAMGLTGLSMLASLAALLLTPARLVMLANLALASLAALDCLIGSIIVTVVGSKGVREINERGQRVGVSAARGNKFYIITWIATGLMLGAALFWFGQLIAARRRGRTPEMREKTAS